jgi:hypothetical protein
MLVLNQMAKYWWNTAVQHTNYYSKLFQMSTYDSITLLALTHCEEEKFEMRCACAHWFL